MAKHKKTKKAKKAKKKITKIGLSKKQLGSPTHAKLKVKWGASPDYDSKVVETLAYQLEQHLPKFADESLTYADVEPTITLALKAAFDAGAREARHMANENIMGTVEELVSALNSEAY